MRVELPRSKSQLCMHAMFSGLSTNLAFRSLLCKAERSFEPLDCPQLQLTTTLECSRHLDGTTAPRLYIWISLQLHRARQHSSTNGSGPIAARLVVGRMPHRLFKLIASALSLSTHLRT